jgi:hypothetical protein
MSGAATTSETETIPETPTPTVKRGGDWWLALVACLGGALFLLSLGRLWPLVPADLHVESAQREKMARRFLEKQGLSLKGYRVGSSLSVDETALDHLEQQYGNRGAGRLIREGAPIVTYTVSFKKPDDANTFAVTMLPNGQVVGWRGTPQEDDLGGRLSADAARSVARNALANDLSMDPNGWREVGIAEREYPGRLDRTFTFERIVYAAPELRERASVRIAGDKVMGAARSVSVPPRALRNARRLEAPREVLMSAGTVMLGGAALGAFSVFLLRLRDGSARLRRAAYWSVAVFLCTLGASLLRTDSVFGAWDPLWPWGVSYMKYVVGLIQNNIWTLLILLAVVAAGDALDTKLRANRGESLWRLTKGKFLDPLVGAAAGRGFLVGLICGGVMAATITVLQQFVGVRVDMQPRGFFFYALNSPMPGLCTLLYFLHVALLEELGYRYFAGSWLMQTTRRKWLAIFLPALVYGLTHTSLSFLPPSDPFWVRPLMMTLVGCVWGWAFLRYDALTVVISHLTADLFIFNWPRLASGDPGIQLSAALTILVPLLPAFGLLRLLRRRSRGLAPSSGVVLENTSS